MPADTPYAGVASVFRSALARGEAPQVFEDGGQTRDFVHVRDVARANRLALTRETPLHGAVNIASGYPRTVLQMAAALADAHGPGAPHPVVTGAWRPGDVRHVVADGTWARASLDFVAAVSFEDGMHEFACAPLRTAG
jgi:dTDP-L-rhamnose 4-epimerase